MHPSLQNCRYPITLQCSLDSASSLGSFTNLLDLLSGCGLYGIELNLMELSSISTGQLERMLARQNLKLTYIATGAYAKHRHLSISSFDSEIRKASIEGCKENIRYAASLGAGIIIGYLKNNAPLENKKEAELLLEASLSELGEFAEEEQVAVLLEATNRYESCVANSISETAAIVQKIGCPSLSLLPDTYHMNIEEGRPLDALATHRGFYHNLHLSDNNRFFPGLGCIDFSRYLKQLDELHYQGTLGIEGILQRDLKTDLQRSVAYLAEIFSPKSEELVFSERKQPERSASHRPPKHHPILMR